MLNIRYVQEDDKEFWFRLDKHLPENEFINKVRDKRGYILSDENKRINPSEINPSEINPSPTCQLQIGLLRYNLFWDSIPFCTMLFIDWEYQNRGYGRKLMEHWENDMKSQGYGMVLVSTQVDESSQHFYRKLGYKDCGGLIIDIPGYAQPMELFMVKEI